MSETENSQKGGFKKSCSSCNSDLTDRKSFRFSSSEAGMSIVRCFRCGLHYPPILKRSFYVAMIVGTILTLLNQGDTVIMGRFDGSLMWKIPLTYCVPFVVATYGALASNRNKS